MGGEVEPVMLTCMGELTSLYSGKLSLMATSSETQKYNE